MSKLIQAARSFKTIFDQQAGDNKTLSMEELSALFKREFHLDEFMHNAAVEYYFSEMDKNKDGAVNFKEFLCSAEELCLVIESISSDDAPKSELREEMKIFKQVYDSYAVTQGDEQTLTKHELVRLLKTEFLPNEDVHEAEADYFLREMDKDGDGVVEFKEFVGFVAEISDILHLI